jgi:hypothetical protein
MASGDADLDTGASVIFTAFSGAPPAAALAISPFI